MNPQDRADNIQQEILAAQDAQELREKLDALLSLFAGGDEISAAMELCKDALRRADELCLAPEDSFHYAVKLLGCLRRRGTILEASALAREIIKRVDSTSIPPDAKAEAFREMAMVAIPAGELDRAAELLEQAAPHAVASGNVRSLAAHHVASGQLFVRFRRFSSAVSSFETASSLYHLIGDAATAIYSSGQAARAHMLAGRFKMASEAYKTAVLSEDVTRRAWVGIAGNYAICLLWLGDWSEAEALLERTEQQAISIGLVAGECRVLTVKALIALRRSKLEEATHLATRALEIARANSLVREELAALECLGETEYERGKPADALRYYAEYMTKGETLGMTDATSEGKRREAEAWNALGEHEKARAAAEQCLAVAATNEDRYEHAVAHRPLAIALSMLGNQEGAERAFRRGVEEIRALGERFELAKTLVEFACHLRDWDGTALTLGAAAEYLREARELFRTLGVERWLGRVEEELANVMRLTEGGGEEAVAVGAAPAVERGARQSFGSVTIVTRSQEMNEILGRLARVAPSNLPVLITGESGTGKELFARVLQELSGRPAERFVAVNCAALPRELHESELFGHERGSFTGATSEKPGLFEQADGGTIFLDEIGDLDAKAQGKLLRVLQDGELRRVGELKQRRVDARVVAATNRDLKKSVREGAFREDLYHRLNGLLVRIPSLRERPEDIEVLVAHYLEHYERRYGRRVKVPAELVAIYKQFSWPGNVRELQQELHRMVLLTADGTAMRTEDSQIVRLAATEDSATVARSSGYDTAIGDAGRRLIVEALQQASGNKAKAARILNMSRTTLIGKIRRLGIE